MRERGIIRYLVLPVALSALLLLAMTAGCVWHHHADSSETSCSICHLSHQPIERPLAVHRAPALALLGTHPEPQDEVLVVIAVIPRLPARAPPSA